MRIINRIIVHCSATRPGWMDGLAATEKRAEIRRWHTDPEPSGNGWSDIGYHWLIDRDGTRLPGRPEERAGAHVYGLNAHSIGVCLIGGHGGAAPDDFSDHFTPAQDHALRDLLSDIRARYEQPGRPVIISGHNQHAAKACPCFDVPEWLAREVKPVANLEWRVGELERAVEALTRRLDA